MELKRVTKLTEICLIEFSYVFQGLTSILKYILQNCVNLEGVILEA